MRAFIVPIFIPNVGCPTRCVFCEQPRITSQSSSVPTPEEITGILRQAITSKKYRKGIDAQVAFYGGTFTRLPHSKMEGLLEAIRPFIEQGYFHSIRVSTRPDSLFRSKLLLMKTYGVKTVELGVQSMDDNVLRMSNRGHGSQDTIAGVKKLKDFGFSVGIQLMPGLPGDNRDSFRKTIEATIALSPHSVRLYPTVVIEGTQLAKMYREGRYQPLCLEDAVEMCAEAVIRLQQYGIPVIRIGLMSSPRLLEPGQVVAGPWHPSLGDLVRSTVYAWRIAAKIPEEVRGKRISIAVNPADLPLLRGHGGAGIKRLESKTGAKVIGIEPTSTVESNQVLVKVV
ncbi:MAG: radical SAM protein [Deltaproteobacteria bacterium]|nr:MAG: radical SAM protein [Deltaproteobacteria bacterium]